MADRFPLIVNSSTQTIEELPAGDNLDLSLSGIANVGNIIVSGAVYSDNYFFANGNAYTTGGGATSGGSGLFNTAIDGVTNYEVTDTMANAVVFASNSIVHSLYITNIDSGTSANISISANVFVDSSNEVYLSNQIPVPNRGAVELLKKPKVFYAGQAIKLQALDAGVGSNSKLHATAVYESYTGSDYIGQSTNISTADTATDAYISDSAASVVESVLVLNNSTVGNIAVTVTVTNASNTVEGYFASNLIVPVNSMIEFCENTRRVGVNGKIRVTAVGSGTISSHISGKRVQ